MSFIADIFGAKSAAKGQQKAADAASASAAASLAEQQRQYDLSRADNRPFLEAGTAAVGRLNALSMGDRSAFMASPNYQFTLDEAIRSQNARNSALGIQDSGAAQKASLKLAQNLASGEYGNYWNQQAGLAGVGQTAVATNQQGGTNFANASTNINTNKANALGSSYINQGNIWGNLWSNLGGQAQQAASMFLGIPGGR